MATICCTGLSLKEAKNALTEHRDSEHVHYHDQGTETYVEGIKTSSMDAIHNHLHLGHTQASLSAALDWNDFEQFCTRALVGATRICAYKHARRSRFREQSFVPFLGLSHFFFRNAIFRGVL